MVTHRLIHRASPGRPSRAELAIVTWLIAYPLITAMLAAGGPALAALPLALRTLVITLVLVPVLSLAVPAAAARLERRAGRGA